MHNHFSFIVIRSTFNERRKLKMSGRQVQITYTRGGRQLSRRNFSLAEAQSTTFGQAVRRENLTAGLGNQFEIFVRPQNGDSEISAHNRETMSLERVLQEVTEDGEVTGKTFIIDATAEHRGAIYLI
jgi:hypothetical protein